MVHSFLIYPRTSLYRIDSFQIYKKKLNDDKMILKFLLGTFCSYNCGEPRSRKQMKQIEEVAFKEK